MDTKGNNYYQTCRMCTGMTQEKAAEACGISLSTLQKYETDQRIPPDHMVDIMAEVYGTPLLAWWHLKTHNALGHHLPDVSPPQSNCDMAFQSVLMADSLDEAVQIIKRLLADGQITDDEADDYAKYLKLISLVTDKGASIGLYAQK